MAGAPESLHVWLENRENIAVPNIYFGGRVCKRKINFLLSVEIRSRGEGNEQADSSNPVTRI
jgi:hypothetical protein